ncbi:hypothetical protein ZWY2020_018493 [Hordeum vulgare]|nr:hypothetical protein ZWY2020_018493 [Hordeum vulgare]
MEWRSSDTKMKPMGQEIGPMTEKVTIPKPQSTPKRKRLPLPKHNTSPSRSPPPDLGRPSLPPPALDTKQERATKNASPMIPKPQSTPKRKLPPLPKKEVKKSRSRASSSGSKSSSTTSKKKSDVPHLGQHAKQSIPPLKVLTENVPPSMQGLALESAKKLAAACGVSVEELLSSQDDKIPKAVVAPKHQFVLGEPLVSKDDLPTNMRYLHQWYLSESKNGRTMIVPSVPKEYYGRPEQIHIDFDELFQMYNGDALDKSLMSCYCLMKILYCKSKCILNIGFIDPDKIHIATLTNYPKETEENLLSFHWILLDIQIDKGRVDAFDPLSRPLEQFQSLQDMLQGVWKRFKCVTPGNFPKKLTFRAAQVNSGFHQCRWGYHNLSVVEDVVENYRSTQIPLDVIWNDDDHMDARKDFTLSPVNYPRPKLLAFLDKIHKRGMKYIVTARHVH